MNNPCNEVIKNANIVLLKITNSISDYSCRSLLAAVLSEIVFLNCKVHTLSQKILQLLYF